MDDKTVFVLSFKDEEKTENILNKVRDVITLEDGVMCYIAIKETAEAILDVFEFKEGLKDPTLSKSIKNIASPDAKTHTNKKGGSQSHIPVRFDLVDGKAMFAMAAVLHKGAEKYGANNWKKIEVEAHLNHLIMHTYAYLAGDRTDDHLSHIMCRAMFAQGVDLQEMEKDTECPHVWHEIDENNRTPNCPDCKDTNDVSNEPHNCVKRGYPHLPSECEEKDDFTTTYDR